MSIKRTSRNIRSKVTRSNQTWTPSTNRLAKNVSGVRIDPESICDGDNDFKTTYVQDRVFNNGTQMWESPTYVECNYVV